MMVLLLLLMLLLLLLLMMMVMVVKVLRGRRRRWRWLYVNVMNWMLLLMHMGAEMMIVAHLMHVVVEIAVTFQVQIVACRLIRRELFERRRADGRRRVALIAVGLIVVAVGVKIGIALEKAQALGQIVAEQEVFGGSIVLLRSRRRLLLLLLIGRKLTTQCCLSAIVVVAVAN